MLITKIYKEFKDNLPTDKFEIELNADDFRIRFKEYNRDLSIMVCETYCVAYVPDKAISIDYKHEKLNLIVQKILEVMLFMAQFARYMENYVMRNTPKYGLVKLIQGEE